MFDYRILAALAALAVAVAHVLQVVKQNRKLISQLKSEVDKFLRPSIVILIGNEIARRIKMKDTEKVTASLAEVDAKGFPVDTPAAFDQPPAWSIDDPTIASLSPSADGSTCDVVAIKPGNANLSVAAQIGGQQFSGQTAVLVTSGDAASIAIQLGAPVAQ